jgi:hypothetical protein
MFRASISETIFEISELRTVRLLLIIKGSGREDLPRLVVTGFAGDGAVVGSCACEQGTIVTVERHNNRQKRDRRIVQLICVGRILIGTSVSIVVGTEPDFIN